LNKSAVGMTHIYTGNGKGKTTAAIGIAIRAMGAGMKVLLVQFMKNYPYSELNLLSQFDELTLKRFCHDEWVFRKEPPDEGQLREAKEGLVFSMNEMCSGNYDMVILDEILVSIYFNLVNKDDVLNIMKKKPEKVELILTGRYCPEDFYDSADLVTEMREVKHYYQKGIIARKGIES